MQVGPFNNKAQGPSRKISSQYAQGPNIYQGLVFSINGMKVRRVMLAKEDVDYNAVEPANFRHA